MVKQKGEKQKIEKNDDFVISLLIGC